LDLDGTTVGQSVSPIVSGVVSGTAIVNVVTAPATLSLINTTGYNVFLPQTPVVGGISITHA